MQRIKFAVLATFVVFGLIVYLAGTRSSSTAQSRRPSLIAPTGLTASDGDYSNKVGLHWDTIRDATTYRIYRNTINDGGTAVDAGTTAANYFFDRYATPGQNYYYWVRAENVTATSGLSAPDQGLRANGTIIPGEEVLDPPPAPQDNPVTAAKAYLGKTLFWDEQMSSTRTVACGTCHRPAKGGSDPRTVVGDSRSTNPGPDGQFGTLDDIFGSPGVPQNYYDGNYGYNPLFGMHEQVTGRKAPSYLNAGYSPVGLFWDGRASDTFRDQLTNDIILTDTASLESQSAGPPVSSAEMGHQNRNWAQVAARIEASKPLALATNIPAGLAAWIGNRTYPELFQEVFGSPEVTPARISLAIATHERTLFSDNTPLDRASYGIETLTASEERGREIFRGVKCDFCHAGTLGTNHNFFNIGVRPASEDAGRFAVSGFENDRSAFKTPPLRNVELRGPYMHNGKLRTIEDVVDFYDRGGDFDAPNVPRGVIHALNLSAADKADLVAFLKRPWTDPRVRDELPPFDRPHLYTESSRMPSVFGRGRPNVYGAVPESVVIAPPAIGNPSFTVGISKGRAGHIATLIIDSRVPPLMGPIPGSGSFAVQSITLSGGDPANGFGSVNLAIPNDPQLVGQTFYGRWYVQDPRADSPYGFAASRAFRFTVF